MRLPFGLGRRSGSGDGAPSDGPGTGSDTGVAVAAPASGRAWASLPPIQRTTGDMPLVAAPDAFVGGLPGSRGLPPIVEPLGHEVSHLATPGLVVARTRAVASPSSAPMPAPVQRRTARNPHVASVQASTAPEAPAEEADAPAPVSFDAPAAAALPMVQPIRSMPTVSRQAVRVPDRPLTSAASAAVPAAVQRAAAAAAAAQAAASGGPALPLPISGGMRRVPSGTSPAKPVVSRQASAPPVEPDTPVMPTPQAAMPVAQRVASAPAAMAAAASDPAAPVIATTQRLGLGAPLAGLPASARPVGSAAPGPIVSRSTTTGPMSVAAAPLLPTAQRSRAAQPSAVDDAPGPVPVSRSAALSAAASPRERSTPAGTTAQRLPALPHLPVARSAMPTAAAADQASHADVAAPSPGAANHGTAPSTSSSAAAGTASPVVATTASTSASATVQLSAAPEIRPIAAANPIRPSFVLQRSASEPDDDDDTGDGAAMRSPWWAPAAEPGPASSAPRPASLDGAAASIQRSARGDLPTTFAARVAGAAAIGASAAPTLSASRGAQPVASLQRSTQATGRPLPLARGAALDPTTRPGSTSAFATSFVAPAAPVAAAPVQGITAGPVVQTSPSADRPPAPFSQRQGYGTTPTVQREDPPGVGTSVGTSAKHASTGGGRSHSEKELEELSQLLFSRIRTRLRLDLIHDREAKGLTFDNV